jgi:hypothetical protein
VDVRFGFPGPGRVEAFFKIILSWIQSK